MKFQIPCEWKCCKFVNVEADSLDEAIDLAYEEDIPVGPNYLDDSFYIDRWIAEEMNEQEKIKRFI